MFLCIEYFLSFHNLAQVESKRKTSLEASLTNTYTSIYHLKGKGYQIFTMQHLRIEHVIEIQALGPCKYPYIRCSSFVCCISTRKFYRKGSEMAVLLQFLSKGKASTLLFPPTTYVCQSVHLSVSILPSICP